MVIVYILLIIKLVKALMPPIKIIRIGKKYQNLLLETEKAQFLFPYFKIVYLQVL